MREARYVVTKVGHSFGYTQDRRQIPEDKKPLDLAAQGLTDLTIN